MRKIVEYNNNKVEQIEVKSAQYIGDFAIRIFFSNGIKRLVDFKQGLENTHHPSIHKYLNEKDLKNIN